MIDPFAFGGTPEQQERRAARARALFAAAEEADSSPHDREEHADPDTGAVEERGSDHNRDVELQSLGQEGEFDPSGGTPEQQERRAARDGALLFAVAEEVYSSSFGREEPADPDAGAIEASDRSDFIGGAELQSLARELELDALARDADRYSASLPVDHGCRSRAACAPPTAAFGRPDDGGAPAIAAAFSRPYGGGVGGIAYEGGGSRGARARRAIPRQKWRRMALLGGGFALLVIGGATVAVLSGRRPNAAPISETSKDEITESADPSGMHHSALSGKKSSKAKELTAVDGLVVLPKSLEPGDSIKVSGTGGPATLNLWNDDRSEIILDFNPRGGENVIVRNSRNQNAWQQEERGGGYPFTQTDGTWDFELVAENDTAVGMVADGTRFGTFDLRRQHKISDVTKLTIHTNHPKQDKPTKDFKVFFTPAEVNDQESSSSSPHSLSPDSADKDNNSKNHDESEENPKNHDKSEENPKNHDKNEENPKNHDQSEENPKNHDKSEENPKNHDKIEENPKNHDKSEENPKNHDKSEENPENRDNNEENPKNHDKSEENPKNQDKSEGKTAKNGTLRALASND